MHMLLCIYMPELDRSLSDCRYIYHGNKQLNDDSGLSTGEYDTG